MGHNLGSWSLSRKRRLWRKEEAWNPQKRAGGRVRSRCPGGCIASPPALGSLTAVWTWRAGRARRSQHRQPGALLTPESVFGPHSGGQREDRRPPEGRHLAGGKRPRMRNRGTPSQGRTRGRAEWMVRAAGRGGGGLLRLAGQGARLCRVAGVHAASPRRPPGPQPFSFCHEDL